MSETTAASPDAPPSPGTLDAHMEEVVGEKTGLLLPGGVIPEPTFVDNAGLLLSNEELKLMDPFDAMVVNPTFLPTRASLIQAIDKLRRAGHNHPGIVEKKLGTRLFEIWSEEYIDAFGEYLAGRAQEMGATKDKPLRVLEVGAGDGRLTYFLRQRLAERAPDLVSVIATDLKSWRGITPVIDDIETASCEEAVKKYEPQIVIWSWPPPGVDHTSEIRRTESVEEYIIIGEDAGGCCGDPWLTWGFGKSIEHGKVIPPYEADGFEQQWLEALSNYNLSMMGFSNETSSTTSFKKTGTVTG
jgi:hypothetical protein